GSYVSRRNADGDILKFAAANSFKSPRVQPQHSTGTHWSCDARLMNCKNASTAQCAARFAKRNGAMVAWSSAAAARQLAIIIGSTFKPAGDTVSHRNLHRFSSTFTNTSSNPDWALPFSHNATHAQLPPRFSFASERTLFTSMLLPTSGFRNYALITLSCGKAFSSCYAVA